MAKQNQNRQNVIPVEVEIKFRAEAAIKKLQQDLVRLNPKVSVDLNVKKEQLDAFIKNFQKTLDLHPRGIQLFNAKTKVNQQELNLYLKKLSDAVNAYFTNNPGIALKIDKAGIQSQLDALDLKINIGAGDVDIDITGITAAFQTLVDTLKSNSGDLDLGTLFSDAMTPLTAFGSALDTMLKDAVTDATALKTLFDAMGGWGPGSGSGEVPIAYQPLGGLS